VLDMTKYYDCPLEAAYMAKNFGVELMASINEEIYKGKKRWFRPDIKPVAGFVHYYRYERGQDYYDILSDFRGGREQFGYTKPERFTVHPDSLHIFEPQVGDIVDFRWGSPEKLNASDPYGGRPASHASGDGVTTVGKDDKIIQRNNLPFIMPKEKE